MNALFLKEIRLILPAWTAALALAVGPVWLVSVDELAGLDRQGTGIACLAFALGAVLLGVAPYGKECTLGTFSLLLAQPMSRRRVWRVKTLVACVGMLLVLAALAVSYRIRIQDLPSREVLGRVVLLCGLVALTAFAGGLWTTLLFRQVAAGLWFTLLAPPAILTATSRLWEKSSDDIAMAGGAGVLAAYSIAGVFLAWRLMLRAQDAPWTGGTLSFPARLGFGTRKPASALTRARRPVAVLLGKEFCLHHVSLILGAAMLLLHLMVVLVRRMDQEPGEPRNGFVALLDAWWVLWLGFPFLVGGTAVAEERKLGTLESQLCLPAPRRTLFAVKLLVALSLGTMLGGLMPWVAEAAGGWEVMPGPVGPANEGGLGQPVLVTCLAAGGMTFFAFYASTLVRNLLQAMGAAALIGFLLVGIWDWAARASAAGRYPPPWGMPLFAYIGLPVVVAALLVLAFRNWKKLDVGWDLWSRNLLTLLASLVVSFAAAAALYDRPWERWMPLEPAHGPARLGGSIPPRICVAAGSKMFALLPDGRLWAARRYELKETDEYEDVADSTGKIVQRRRLRIPSPVGGVFLGSNWVNLAASDNQVFGIRLDGTLWKVFSLDRTVPWWNVTNLSGLPKPEREGTDSDWKAVEAGQNHFLGLKTDGTLWGWGDNHYAQLGGGVGEFARRPVRIGMDSDWASVFAAAAVSIGVRRDGSVWKWGGLAYGPTGRQGWKSGPHGDPVKWNLDGTDWNSLAGEPLFDLVVRRDGTLWAAGNLPENLFGIACRREFAEKFRRIGRESDWADVAGRFRCMAGLKKDGTLLFCDTDIGSIFWRRTLRKPSKYSDWIGVGAGGWYESVALASDGTLCAWSELGRPDGLLAPSRKPLWSLNIYATSAEAGLMAPGQR